MKGDFSRDTFNPSKHYDGVLMQQGRVLLDADWNEQQDIQRYLLRTFIKDLIGPFGTPCKPDGSIGEGFSINWANKGQFWIGWGHYYVEGVLCENASPGSGKVKPKGLLYSSQPDYPVPKRERTVKNTKNLVYLDVWERHISYIEDDEIRETALGGPDTACRSKVVWQVKVEKIDPILKPKKGEPWNTWVDENWNRLYVEKWQPRNRGSLRARVRTEEKNEGGENYGNQPDRSNRILENHLYRVEIHRGGAIDKGDNPSFKWSRENGSVVFPVIKQIHVDDLGKRTKLTVGNLKGELNFVAGDWVEIIDDEYALLNQAKPLLKVTDIDLSEMQVTLEGTTDLRPDPEKNHSLLRRWDQKSIPNFTLNNDGAIAIKEFSENDPAWIPLEDGIEIQFIATGKREEPHKYRTGDYWLIPARTATGDIEWPRTQPNGTSAPKHLPPHGVTHHYAPLAILLPGQKNPIDLRRKMKLHCF